MSVAVYDPCPCGSGAKFKFCCRKKGGKGKKPNVKTAPVVSDDKDQAPQRDGAIGELIPPNSDDKGQAPQPVSSTGRKISELVLEVARDFLSLSSTIEERQHRLTAVSSAWNMACGTAEVRQYQLNSYRQEYLRYNPATAAVHMDNIIKDMELLINRKLEMFPEDMRRIVSARVFTTADGYRYEISSATLE